MKEESDIPLLKSYNKDTTVIETDPFMEKEIDELIRAYAQPQEIVRRLRDVGYSEEEVRQSYKFQFYCEILKQIQKDKEEEKAELRLSIPFIVSLVVFSLFSLFIETIHLPSTFLRSRAVSLPLLSSVV